MLDFLPQNVKKSLEYLNIRHIYEIRLRQDKPITVNYLGKYVYLGEYGITELREKALCCDTSDIEDCVYRAGNYSVYSVEEQLKKGFITAKEGERLGLAGEYVFENGKPHTLRNFSSLCIRVPHEVVGCGEEIYQKCMSDRVHNLLVMSSPGLGKTTILRDLSRLLAKNTKKNILICDERGEISSGEVGESCDVVKFSDKATAFEAGIRAMRPEIIITDELYPKDSECLKNAVCAGVTVIASAHISEIAAIPSSFLEIFERFVLLDMKKIGQVRAIYCKEELEGLRH